MASRRASLIELLIREHPDKSEKELRAAILRGHVTVNGDVVLKPGVPVHREATLVLRPSPAYVSRGGDKLAAALDAWGIDCRGSPWIDAGCSTGGFTDCLLRRGAPLVYAVDVGEGQLDWGLRTDARVRAMEGTNIMALSAAAFDPPAGRAAADLSFRSLKGAARHILGLTREGRGIFLVKPQFELGAAAPADFRGVVRDPAIAREAVAGLLERLAAEGVAARRGIPSPVAGRRGNREYLLLLETGRADPAETAAVLSGLFAE